MAELPAPLTPTLDAIYNVYEASQGDGFRDHLGASLISKPCTRALWYDFRWVTPPLHFWSALQGANVADGSLARFLILPSDEDYPDENLSAGLRNAPPELVSGLQLVAAGGGRSVGNLAGKTSGSNGAADAVVVPMTPEAKACFATLSAEMTVELRAAAGTAFTAILARIGENALKLALIVAVGRDPVQPVIERGDAEWTIAFVRHFAKRTMDAVERHVADTETEAHLKRVREIIRAAGSEGVSKSEITRSSQWLKARDRDDILATLVESGDIKPVMRNTAGRSAMVFQLVSTRRQRQK